MTTLPVRTKVIKSLQDLWKVGLVMRGRLKTIVCSLMGAVLMIGSASAVTVNGSFCGINDYLDEPDRAGATYVSKLNTELAVVFGSSYNYSGTLLKDSQVTASALKSRLNASPKTIFAFSGHGYVNGPMSYDSTIVPKEAIRTQHRYVVMYSCNWMTNNGLSSEVTRIYNTFNGTRLQLGYAYTMYLDSREGYMFGQNLQNQTVVNAFLRATRVYQPQQKKNDVIARVMGYTNAKNDYITTTSAAPSYSSSKNSFSIIVTETIPHTGRSV